MCEREREPRENEIGHAHVLSCMPVCTELQLQTLVIDVLMNNGSSRTSPKKCEPPTTTTFLHTNAHSLRGPYLLFIT